MKNLIFLLILSLILSNFAYADDLGKYNLPYGTDGFKAVGQSWTPTGHCIVWDGTIHSYDYPGLPETGCFAMNSVGQAIGEAHNSTGTSVKFKIDIATGAMTSFGFTGPAGTIAWAAEDIDDTGNILVRYTQRVYDAAKRAYITKSRACISNGSCLYTYPDYPGARSTYYYALNNSGDAVGSWYDAANKQRGFVFTKATSTFQNIDYPGSIETSAVEINDYGVVAGFYCSNKPSSYCEQYKGLTWSAGNFTIYDKGYSTILTGVGNNGRVAGQVWIGNQYYKETFGFLE